jgi:serine/threonine protein kinase
VGIKCPRCFSDNSDTQRFCGECGAPLDVSAAVPVSQTKTIETPREELTTGSTFAGRYQIVEELGHGGMGRVYRALDKKINEEVALKLIKPEIASEKRTLERFANELKIARKIAHKNVGRMYHLSEDKGTHYITMEYIPGEDLRRMIRMSRQLSIATAVDVARQISEGLADAHRQGVVHRDLKPGNIMIDREGNARIMDFGIARLVTAKGITGAGVAVGTPEYMSPEQVDGKEADPRADIYSLGIILYEMVTGRLPFEADTPYAIGFKHKNEQPVSPKALNSQVPDDLSGLILRCLEKDPSRRPQTADELRSDLEKSQKGLPTTAHAIPVPKRKPLSSREITIKFMARKLLVPGLVIVGCIAVIVLGVVLLSRRPPAKKTSATHKQITFTGTASHPAISPDGKFLAYSDNFSGNEQIIMVRDLVGGQTLEVGRGRDCGGLRWSPDGSELSFHSENDDGTWTTQIVPRLGGRARQLDGLYGAAWSPDGTQLAHWSDEKKLLFFVNKTTGESKSISLGKSCPPYADYLDWSPSGKFISLSMYDDDDNYSIWTVSVDGRYQNETLNNTYAYSPRWSPRGDAIYYLLEGDQTTDLLKVAISPDTGKPLRAPVPVLEGHQLGDFITITNDGKSMACTREIYYSNLWLVSLEGSGESQKVNIAPLTAGTMLTMAPSFSPDGRSIAYGRGKSTMDIFIIPAQGGPSQQLTFLNAWSICPVWSPDGKEIAFASSQGGSKIWSVSASGGTPKPLAKAEGMWPAWAPGSKILFQTSPRMNLMAYNPDKEEMTTIFKTDSEWQMLFPAWSLDGRQVAVQYKKGPETGPGIWILSVDGSPERRLWKGLALPIYWSPDGRILYASKLVSGKIIILTISTENGREAVVFTIPLSREIGRPILRPHTVDGRRFVFEARKSQSDIWVVENFDPDIK